MWRGREKRDKEQQGEPEEGEHTEFNKKSSASSLELDICPHMVRGEMKLLDVHNL